MKEFLREKPQAAGMCGLNHIAGNHVVGSSLPANLYLDVFLFNAPISEAKHSYAGPSDEGEAGGRLVMGPGFSPSGPSGSSPPLLSWFRSGFDRQHNAEQRIPLSYMGQAVHFLDFS